MKVRINIILSSCLIWVSLSSSGCGGHSSPATHQPDHQNQTVTSLQVSARQFDRLEKLADEEMKRLRKADLVLIGETHDHPQHHLIQAEVIRALKPKVVAFEMLDHRHQPVLDKLHELSPDTWDQALDWTKRGWPDFELYRPVFEASLDVGVKLLAVHPTPQTLHPLMLGRELPQELRHRLKLDTPLPEDQQQALRQLIHESHCGYANAVMVQAMIKAQRLKDAWMAERLMATAQPAILIVGRGHTHQNRGIPWAIKTLSSASSPRVITLALSPHETSKFEHNSAQISLKIPSHRRDDPCERFREQLQKMKNRKAHSSGQHAP